MIHGSRRFSPTTLLALLSLFVVPDSSASWPTDPAINVPICTALDNQFDVRAISDGAGGAIFCWTDVRSGNQGDFYAQRVSAGGDVLWATDGVPVCTSHGDKLRMDMISDGAGGAIIAWTDSRNVYGDIYAQRIGPDGVPLWPVDGIALCTAAFNQDDVTLASDGAGGAVAGWIDSRNGLAYFAYAQRITGQGVPLWTSNGVPVSSRTSQQLRPQIVSDAAGGAIVTWLEWISDGVTDVYAQRIDALGQVLWGSGAVVCDEPSTVYSIQCVPDAAGGVLVFFDDDRNGLLDLYGQRLAPSGARLWAAPGAPFCVANGHQQFPFPVPDGAGGAVLTWFTDRRDQVDNSLFAQRVGSDGASAWTPDGVRLSDADGIRLHEPAIDGDGAGGAVIAWHDNARQDIYAQRLDASGGKLWGDGGMLVSGAVGTQYGPAIVDDGAGGAIVAWADQRKDSTLDVYAQHVPFDGPVGVLVLRVEGKAIAGEADLRWELRDFAGLSFEVQRRTEREGWISIGRPDARAGAFSHVDRDVAPGTRYGYRLASGAETLGEVWVEIPSEGRLEILAIRPNPSRDGTLRVEFTLAEAGPADLEIFDLTGRRVATRSCQPSAAARRSVELQMKGDWPPGVYLARLSQAHRSTSARVVVVP